MTKEQIKFLKSILGKEVDGKPLAYSTTVVCNDHDAVNTMKDFILWDDTNEMMYAVRINDDPQSQIYAPVKVTATSYETVFFLNSIYTPDHFDTVVDSMFTFLSDEKKQALKNFARSIPVQANGLNRKIPYYENDNKINIVQSLKKPNETNSEEKPNETNSEETENN